MSGSQEAIAPFSGHAQASISSTQMETAEIEAMFSGDEIVPMQAHFNHIYGSLDRMNESLDRINGSLDRISATMDRLEKQMNEL